VAQHRQQPVHCARELVLACSIATIIAGCGGVDDGVPVSGTITYRDQPFSNASITFYPVSGRPVSAAISEGEYSTVLKPGEYKVTVSLGVNVPPGWKEGDPILHTQLSATVSEDQSEPIDFKLE
jgi:hypothetical protein